MAAALIDPARVFVLDDDATTRSLLQGILEEQGYRVQTYSTMQHAMLAVQRDVFDLYLLDLVLPDGDGLTLCRRLRTQSDAPIIILTTRGSMDDVVAGLEQGADDYVTKPFRAPELVARVQAQLRRIDKRQSVDLQRIGPLLIDRDLRDVFIDGVAARLSPKEFEIFDMLAARRGRVVTKDAIVEAMWGEAEDVSEKILAVYIRRIRCKIEKAPDQPELLQTVRGVGYRLTS
jgi:DNA-binding response OmpR family regulator